MSRLLGIIKVTLVLAFDFIGIYNLFHNAYIAGIAVGIIAVYVLFGGYIAISRDNAVSIKNIPVYQRSKLEAAKAQLAADVKSDCGADISGLKLYLVPNDDDMNAAAYGFNCVSVTRATLDNTDPIMLNAVLAHEISHILNFDAEFNRAVFCSVTLLIGTLSVMSFAVIAIVSIIFLIFSCFRSLFGVIAFRGTAKTIKGFFGLLQRGIVISYNLLLNLFSRHAEYRSDKFSCGLGYGLQLSHFLAIADPAGQRRLTLAEAIYNSHPPTPKRIARLERQLLARQ